MDWNKISIIASILASVVSLLSIFIASKAIIKVNKLTIKDNSKKLSQVAKGKNNKQSIKI